MPLSLSQAVARLAAHDDRPDAALLRDFLRAADEAAFAELVRRHGPMILGVCRRVLGRSDDADDAFQATFLVLVRRARQTVWRESLGPWLYGVAVRVARKARFVRSRRLATERQASPMTPEPTTPAPELDDSAAVLDDELAALPDAYRRPLVLCELQGKSRKDAARELGLAEGTLSSRLARGRQLLRGRLARRGVGLTATGLSVAVPAELASATAGRAVAVLTGAAGAVPAGILGLTEGVVKTMIVKWKLAAVVVAAGIGLTGFGAWNGRAGPAAVIASEPPAAPAAAKPDPAAQRDLGNPPDLTFTYSPPPSMDQPVATIFGDEQIPRRQFAEYLIQRHGKKELELFVNKQIVARAFGKKAWTISGDDVHAALQADLKAIGVTAEEFEKTVLPKYGKTLPEWIEDVITPRLMMSQLVKSRVTAPTEDELRRAFDAKYGEKVEVRVIVWPKDRGDEARSGYEKLRAEEETFGRAAREQTNPTLRAAGGRIYPVPRARPLDTDPAYTDPAHAAAAKLKIGEVSPLIETKVGFVVVKCDRVLAADASKTFDAEKPMLLKEVIEAKINREMPKLFDEIKQGAKPVFHLTFPDPVAIPHPVPQK
ncbi:MAG: sigE 56 [Gemmataceae bacterium]|nr:sigE 56 [Gemmataceae bacterium]